MRKTCGPFTLTPAYACAVPAAPSTGCLQQAWQISLATAGLLLCMMHEYFDAYAVTALQVAVERGLLRVNEGESLLYWRESEVDPSVPARSMVLASFLLPAQDPRGTAWDRKQTPHPRHAVPVTQTDPTSSPTKIPLLHPLPGILKTYPLPCYYELRTLWC